MGERVGPTINQFEPLCMTGAKVFVAENNPEWGKMYEDLLKKAGYKVVLTATNMTDALAAVQKFGELGVKVALVNRNLCPFDDELINSGKDGRELVAAIHKQAPGVKIVGVSLLGMVDGADAQVDKIEIIEKLSETVTKLLK